MEETTKKTKNKMGKKYSLQQNIYNNNNHAETGTLLYLNSCVILFRGHEADAKKVVTAMIKPDTKRRASKREECVWMCRCAVLWNWEILIIHLLQ